MSKGKYSIGSLEVKKGLVALFITAALVMAITPLKDIKANGNVALVIHGYVYDENGSPVAGAVVRVRDLDTGAWGENITMTDDPATPADETGYYSITLGAVGGTSELPWGEWYDGDTLLGVATYGGRAGSNDTVVNVDGGPPIVWLNITLGTPITTKHIGEPNFTRYDYDNGSTNSGFIATDIFYVGSEAGYLSFWTWWQIEGEEPSSYDLMNVYISTDGGNTWQLLATLNPTSDPTTPDNREYMYYSSAGFNTPGVWQYVEIDISDYIPNNISIKFEFDTVDDAYNYWEGWYVDDIKVFGYDEGTVFFDDVESGVGNWTYNGFWHITTHRSYSGTHAWYYGIEHSYVTSDTPFNFTVEGNYTGLYYRIWNGSWHPPSGFYDYTGNFTLGNDDGLYYLEFYAVNDTNEEPSHNQSHYVDNTPPTSTVEFGHPATLTYNGDNYTAIKICSPMWINASDGEGVGVAWLNYSVWWNPDEPENFDQLYFVNVTDNDDNDMDKRVGYISVELHFTEECFHEIKWQMADYFGHISPQYSIDIAVDGTPPTINKTIGEPNVTKNGDLWVSCETPIYIHVTDDGCGGGVGVARFGINVYWNETKVPAGEEQEFTLIDTIVVEDGGAGDLDGEQNGEITYVFYYSQDCFHEPEFWAEDYAGNIYSFKERELVDCTPPGMSKNIEKIVALEQPIWNTSTHVAVEDDDDYQSFVAPWSYIDAVSVFLYGTFTGEDVWIEIYDDDNGMPGNQLAESEHLTFEGSIQGWFQFHLLSRLYVEHNATYWIRLCTQESSTIYWRGSNESVYDDGYAIIDGEVNYSWDLTFKIEYYPIYPYFYPMEYSFFNETIEHDGLNETWLTSNATLVLDAWDEGCMGGVGLKSLLYRIYYNDSIGYAWHPTGYDDYYCGNHNITYVDGKYWYVAINETVSFTEIRFHEECEHILQVRAEDLLGNVRMFNQTHYVDNSPPALHIEYPNVHGFYYDEETGKQFVRAGKTFWLNLTDEPDDCAVGWRNFTFYWRYEYWNYTSPEKEKHPVNYSDDEYGDVVEINGELWWKIVPESASIPLRFNRECLHSIYYFYEATDWLDNSINTSDNVTKVDIYVDAYDPEVYKEHPACYNEEEPIYLHPYAEQEMPPAEEYPFPGLWLEGTEWHELYPEYCRNYSFGYWQDSPVKVIWAIQDGLPDWPNSPYITAFEIPSGRIVKQFMAPVQGNGRGLAFDGSTLYYTLIDYPGTIFMTDTNGDDLGSIQTSEDRQWGPLTWDGTQLWAAALDGSGDIYTINVSTGAATYQFTFTGWIRSDDSQYGGVGYIDGLEYDRITHTLWLSDDAGKTVYHVDTSGNVLSYFSIDPNGNTGIVCDEDKLWLAIYEPSDPDSSYPNGTIVQTTQDGIVLTSFLHDGKLYEDLAGVDTITFSEGDGYIGPSDYISMYDEKYGVYRAYHVRNVTITMWIYNETLDEYKYIEFVAAPEGNWTNNFYWVMYTEEGVFGSHWHEVYPNFCTNYILERSDDPLYMGTTILLNNSGELSNWTIMDTSIDLVLEPVPFIQACQRINLTAKDMPDMLKRVDQFQTEWNETDTLQGLDKPTPWDAQSFTPTADAINEVRIYIRSTQSAEITLRIMDSAFNTLAEVTKSLGPTPAHWEAFVFDPPVSVTPGETYWIEVRSEPADNYVWYFAYNNPYPNGHAYISSHESLNNDWTFQIISYLPNPCASGIEGIYYGYVYEGEWHPKDMNDNTSLYGEVINISQYYSDEEIRQSFDGHYLWYVYDDSIGIHFREECIHWLYYWAKDNVCHHTPVHMQVYHVDEYKPVIEKTHPDHGYYAPIEIDVDDTFENYTADNMLSGSFHVRNEWYWDASDGWMPNPSGQYVYKKQNITFTITNHDLNHDAILTLYVKEVVGDEGITLKNGTDQNEWTYYDIVVPAGDTIDYVITVYDYYPFLRWGVWEWKIVNIENVTQYLRLGANITLEAHDPGYCASGVEAIFWRYEWNGSSYPLPSEAPMSKGFYVINGSELAKYGYDENITDYWWYVTYSNYTNISFDEECEHILYYFAKDRVCHNSTLHVQRYFVDGSNPVVEEILPEHGAIGGATVSLEEDFEVPLEEDGWYVSGDWYRVSDWWPYNADGNNSHSGRYCAFGYADFSDPWLITPRITVPEDGNLTFWYKGSGEFEVAVSLDTQQNVLASFSTIWQSGTFSDSIYRKVEIDLSSYAGQQVYIGFHILNGDIFVDDVWVGGIHRIAVPFKDTMENETMSMQNWSVDDLTVDGSFWQIVDRVPVYNTTPPAPSVWCGDLSLGNAPNGFGMYGCNWIDTLKLKDSYALDLSGLAADDNVTLEFWTWYDLENGADYLYIEASIDGENWSLLEDYTGGDAVLTGDSGGVWVKELYNLSSYIGNDTVLIRFRFVSDDYNDENNGVFIDNVSIYNTTETFFTDVFNDLSKWDAIMLETSRWHIIDVGGDYGNVWWNGNDTDGEYLNCMNDALITKEIDLSGYEGYEAVLMFWHKYDMEEDYDYGFVEVSNDSGVTWKTIAIYNGARDWVQEFIDLTDYIGDNILIRFRFYSDESVVDDGWFIDNVRVEIREITETAFYDDFEKTFPPSGWMEKSYGDYDAVNDTDYQTWERWADTGDYVVASITPWYGWQEEWLISPLIPNLPKFSNLTFWHDFYTDDGIGQVLISTTGTDPEDFTVLYTCTPWESGWVDIPLWDYAGKDIYIAFRFNTSYGEGFDPYSYDEYDEYWDIDDINITSIGFLRACAPVYLNASDLPDNDCKVGVSGIYWRIEYKGFGYPWGPEDGFGDGFGFAPYYPNDYGGMPVKGSEIPGITPEDEEIYDYWWWFVADNSELDKDPRVGYVSVEVHLQEDCIHDIYYFAKDWLCHSSELHHERWYVDGTPPETDLGISWGNHPWIPRNYWPEDMYDAPLGNGLITHEDWWNHMYTPWEVEDGYAPEVICINDDVHLEANHTRNGNEPCIYPYNWSNATYYRWAWYNESSGEWEFWPTPDTPGAINGSSIVVSEHADKIQYNDDSDFWLGQEPPFGGYIYWMKYTEPFYFPEGCEHILYYFSKDDLCNTEEPNEWHVGVDDMPPTSKIDFDVTTGTVVYNEDENVYYFQNCTWFIINATDMPNNTDCQTGIWYIDYTVWRWVGESVDVYLATDQILETDMPVYMDGTLVGWIWVNSSIDSNNNGVWDYGDYVTIKWLSSSPYHPGETIFYLIEEISGMPGSYKVTLSNPYQPGWKETLIDWTRVYEWEVTETPTSPQDGIKYDKWYDPYTGREYIRIWIHLGDLVDFPCGKYEIHWEVYDYNNMTEGEKKQDVIIDCTPPRTKKEFSEPVIEEEIAGGEIVHWVSPTTKIWLNGTDDFVWDSGVNETWYKFWEEEPILLWKYGADTFEQPYYPGVYSTNKHYFTVDEAAQIMGYDNIIDYFAAHPTLAAGIIELYHWSVDNVSHVEDYQPSKQHIYVDAMPPVSRVDDIEPYQQEDVPFNVTVVDIEDYGFEDIGPIGVCKVEVYYNYSNDNFTSSWTGWILYDTYYVPWSLRNDVPNWTFAFDAPNGAGWYRFKSIAYDCLNNVEQPPFYYGTYDAECLVVADTEPPVITKEYGQPNIEVTLGNETIHIIKSTTPIWLNATDMPEDDWTGIDKIFWSWYGVAGTWYNMSFDGAHEASVMINAGGLPEGEIHHIFFKATDMLGHETEEYKQKFIIDNTAPETTITIEGNDSVDFDNREFNVTIDATDAIAGVENITLYFRYSPDGETWSEWMPYSFNEWNLSTRENSRSITISFCYNPDDGYYKPGYYEFYVYAADYLGNAKGEPVAEASCYVAPIAEDFNGDGHVNIMDLYEILMHWDETGEPGWIPQDLNNDGVIDVDDVYALLLKWTG